MDDNDQTGRPPASFLATRRNVLRALGALGLSTSVLSPLGMTAAFGADFDWKKFAGTKINLLMVGGEGDDRAFADLVPEFEAETGMSIEITAPALGPLIEKTLQNLQAPQSA